MKEVLKIQDLKVSFGSREVVHGVSFSVKAGETLALVGESGSGKSVTCLSILRLLEASYSGQIALLGASGAEQVLQMSEKALQRIRGRSVSMVFQEPMTSLNPVYTCGYQVEEVMRIHEGISKKAARARCVELFREVQLPRPEAMLRAYPHQISGGQKQRVMIAMALACGPELLIADEPTTALDLTVQKHLLDLFYRLQQERGMAMLFVTHDLAVVRQIAHRVAVMYQGNLVEHGSADQVLQSPEHPYTKGLLACRPAPGRRSLRLPTVKDALSERLNAPEFTQERPKPREGEELLRVQDLEVHYLLEKDWLGRPRKWLKAVDGVSFELRQGRTLGLVGESGCGKSTLGRAVLRLQEPTGGKVFLEGEDLGRLSAKGLRKKRRSMQLIFQDPFASLNPRMRIGEAVAKPMWVHRMYPTKRQCQDAAVALLEQTGIESSMLKRFPYEFSGGQRQRIGIARALGLKPKLLVCDESVAALDLSVQAQILNLLLELQERFGLSYLFISHDLNVVQFLSDYMMVMKDGKVVEAGEPKDLFGSPKEAYTQGLMESLLKV
jgi:peptide/nickel transport system ATP-binding protein